MKPRYSSESKIILRSRKVEVKYLCGRGIDFALFYDFDFEIVPTVMTAC
jgi:hypothetical protein